MLEPRAASALHLYKRGSRIPKWRCLLSLPRFIIHGLHLSLGDNLSTDLHDYAVFSVEFYARCHAFSMCPAAPLIERSVRRDDLDS